MSGTKMTDQRKGEIAVAVQRYRMRDLGIFLNSGVKRDLGQIAKETGIPKEEIADFFEIIIKEATEEFFHGEQK